MDVAAHIEKKRRALLAIIAPWMAFLFCHSAVTTKPLPPRIAAFALATIGKLERAAGYLLIASIYAISQKPRRSSAVESTAACLSRIGAGTAPSRVTNGTLQRRLAELWRILSRLTAIARYLARRLQHQRFLRPFRPARHPTHAGDLAAIAPTALPVIRDKTGPP